MPASAKQIRRNKSIAQIGLEDLPNNILREIINQSKGAVFASVFPVHNEKSRSDKKGFQISHNPKFMNLNVSTHNIYKFFKNPNISSKAHNWEEIQRIIATLGNYFHNLTIVKKNNRWDLHAKFMLLDPRFRLKKVAGPPKKMNFIKLMKPVPSKTFIRLMKN